MPESLECQAQGLELGVVGDLGATEEFHTDKRHRVRSEWERLLGQQCEEWPRRGPWPNGEAIHVMVETRNDVLVMVDRKGQISEMFVEQKNKAW